MRAVLSDREKSIMTKGSCGDGIRCDTQSVAGSVSQRACVYCGARVVLNPITDAFHIVHGPIGCASYTWDIRGSLSSGQEYYRNSFSTDMQETDVIFGGEKKLAAAIDEVVAAHKPAVIFIYSTCIVGVIGDDVDAVCRRAEEAHGIRVISVKSPGFAGHKAMGYRCACDALMELFRPTDSTQKQYGVNILGDFNLAGEMWIIENYLKEAGIPVIAKVTGDAKCEEIIKAPQATLNIVQCAGSMGYLAKNMEETYGIPSIRVSFFGVEDTSASLLRIADALGDSAAARRVIEMTERMGAKAGETIKRYRQRLEGRRAAIYVGGGFKAISLIKHFKDFGIKTVVVGTQTGKPEDYQIIESLVEEDCVILDDANPSELEKFLLEMEADILVGGVKERPLAYKLGVAFCDHNHERRHALAGFEGIENFAREIHSSITTPVWELVKGSEPL